MGDVLGIYDTSGTLVAKYIYDAWGNCTISGETTNNTLAHANPIRYRGYYYDDDTGLYYCNARYYSPKWRRFISPDDTAYLDPENVNGLNLYCYCNNDPINYIDPSGHMPKWLAWIISGIEVAAGIALCFVPGTQGAGVAIIGMGTGSIISGYLTEANGGSFTAGWTGGQIAGALSAIPVVGTSVAVFAGSVATDWIDHGWNGIDWKKATWSGVIAFGLNYGPITIGAVADFLDVDNIAALLVNTYNAIWTGAASSIVNAYWKE